MPPSVIILGDDPKLFESVRETLRGDRRFIDNGDSLHCGGSAAPLTNIYAIETAHEEWEGWAADGSALRNPQAMSALVLECRSADWVAEIGRLLAQRLDTALWFVDSADAVWPAAEVDPDRIRLS